MSRTSWIRAKVEPGTFSRERVVSFEADGKDYILIVDEADVKDDALQVYVIAEKDDKALVDLPRETFTSGNRVLVSKSQLVPA